MRKLSITELVFAVAAIAIVGCGGNSPSYIVDDADGGGGGDTSSEDPDGDGEPEITVGEQLLGAADPKLTGFDEWPLAFDLDPGDYSAGDLTCLIELSRQGEPVRELAGTVGASSCEALWDGLDLDGAYLTPGPVAVKVQLFAAGGADPVAELTTALEVVRLGLSEIQLSAAAGAGQRIALLWAEMDGQLEGYWELQVSDPPWRIGPDFAEDAAAVDLELADGTPRALPAPWTDVESPPLDPESADGSEQDTFNLPTAFEVGSEIIATATLSAATAGNPDGYDPELVEVRVVAPAGTTSTGDGTFGHDQTVSVVTGDGVVPSVGRYQLELDWSFEARTPDGDWLPIPGGVSTTHNLYGVVGEPVLGSTAIPHRAWVEVVDQVAAWVDGEAADAVEVATIVTHGVYDDLALYYDTAHGACHYTYYPGWSYDPCYFEVAEFQRRENGSIINCSDAGAILSTYLNMVGVDFRYHILTNAYTLGFDLNYIMAIGGTEFDETPFDDNDGSFNYHAVVGPADGTIYDATLLLDGDGTPTAPPHTPLYPTDMDEWDYLVALSSQASQIDVSYDEKVILPAPGWKSSAIPGEAGDGSPTRAGVDVDELLPAGLAVLTIRPSRGAGLPVRLTVADRPGGAPLAQVGVVVAAGRTPAVAALDTWRRSVAKVARPTVVALGDQSYGDDAALAFVRDNVTVIVQPLVDDISAVELALYADAAIAAQPFGDPVAGELEELVIEDAGAERGEPITVPVGPEYLSAEVLVDGPGYARRTADGWVVVRTGAGPITASVVGVDHRLRTFR